MALAFGVLGIAAGIEAVYYMGKVGASGDDYTGLLAIPAGLLLLGLGVVTLWRTRRADGGLPRRFVRRSLLGAAGVVGFLYVVLPIGMAYVDTHTARAVVPAANLGVPYEQVSFHHQRRPEAVRLVRAVTQRRRRDRVPRPHGPASAHPDARASRVRRAALRSPRRGRERWRPHLLGLGQREGHQGGDRVPPAPRGRRSLTGSAGSGCRSAAR